MRARERAAAVAVAALVAFVATGAATAALPKSCPSAAVVNAALGQKGKTPKLTRSQYVVTCTYPGSGPVATKIEFETDTAASFTAGEKGAAALHPVKVSGLGKAAWTLQSGGDLDVFTGTESIKILSPFSSAAKLEALARKLL